MREAVQERLAAALAVQLWLSKLGGGGCIELSFFVSHCPITLLVVRCSSSSVLSHLAWPQARYRFTLSCWEGAVALCKFWLMVFAVINEMGRIETANY